MKGNLERNKLLLVKVYLQDLAEEMSFEIKNLTFSFCDSNHRMVKMRIMFSRKAQNCCIFSF